MCLGSLPEAISHPRHIDDVTMRSCTVAQKGSLQAAVRWWRPQVAAAPWGPMGPQLLLKNVAHASQIRDPLLLAHI